jgi:hypothetical protein
MGNMVIVAVRHKDLERIEKMTFESVSSAINLSDASPKRFDLDANGYSPEAIEFYGLSDNLLVSHYHHAAGDTLFYINNQSMTFANFLAGAKIGQEDEVGLEAHIATLRFNARQQRLSVVKNRKADPVPRLTGEAYSVFGLFTDQFNALERNPHVMEDIAHYCRYKEIRLRTFSATGEGIKPLGTFKAGQALVVLMSKYVFFTEIWPSQAFNFNEVEQAALLRNDDPDKAKSPSLDALMIRELAEGAGYSTIIKVRAGRPA